MFRFSSSLFYLSSLAQARIVLIAPTDPHGAHSHRERPLLPAARHRRHRQAGAQMRTLPCRSTICVVLPVLLPFASDSGPKQPTSGRHPGLPVLLLLSLLLLRQHPRLRHQRRRQLHLQAVRRARTLQDALVQTQVQGKAVFFFFLKKSSDRFCQTAFRSTTRPCTAATSARCSSSPKRASRATTRTATRPGCWGPMASQRPGRRWRG